MAFAFISKATRWDTKTQLSATAKEAEATSLLSRCLLLRCPEEKPSRSGKQSYIRLASELTCSHEAPGDSDANSKHRLLETKRLVHLLSFKTSTSSAQFSHIVHEEDHGVFLLKPWRWKLLLTGSWLFFGVKKRPSGGSEW